MSDKTLIFGIGNESRGDDALAPALLRKLQQKQQYLIDLIEDYQLQVEHVTDMIGRQTVLFVDADMKCNAPFQFSKISPLYDQSYTSHAMSPWALLHAYRQVYSADPPESFLLRLRGYAFNLGEDMSPEACTNLEFAFSWIELWLNDVAVVQS